MQAIKAPVLLVTFNRPDTTRKVFEVIRQAKPEKLYISSDGPRDHKYEEDWTNISECRQIVNEVDWECEVHTRFLEKNQGCGPGVANAITWAFENEDRLIILEDDCVPSLSFFPFCNQLLERYKDNIRIMNISGTRWTEEFPISGCDYFYTRYANIWGWATWKRAWRLHDFSMKDYLLFKKNKILNMSENDYAPLIKRWFYLLDSVYNKGRNDVWDYQWQYALFKYNGLSVNSVKNLVTNIGSVGTHINKKNSFTNRKHYDIDTTLLQAPVFPYPEYGFDKYHGRKFYLRDRNDLKILYDVITSKISFLNK